MAHIKAIVVAMDTNRGIGADNDLLWIRDVPADLANFKKLTSGGTVIMGRKTFESIGKALPERQNIVISRGSLSAPGVQCVDSLEAAYAFAESDIFVIGGGQIYQAALSDMDRLHVTEIKAEFSNAEVFFPRIDPAQWREISRQHHKADERNKYDFDFVTYVAK